MLGWMNAEALRRTLETGEVWFFSRSRSELWHKGETSGQVQTGGGAAGRLRPGRGAGEGAAAGRRRRLPRRLPLLLLPRGRGRPAGGAAMSRRDRPDRLSRRGGGPAHRHAGARHGDGAAHRGGRGSAAGGAGGARRSSAAAWPGASAVALGLGVLLAASQPRLHDAEVGRRGLSRLAGRQPDPASPARSSTSPRRQRPAAATGGCAAS